MMRFFEKKVIGVCQIFLFDIKMGGVETEWLRLGEVVRGTKTVSRGGNFANLEA